TGVQTCALPIAFAINGTVREARGLASITYTSSPFTANWIFNNPLTLSAFANRIEYSSIFCCTFSDKLNGGSTAEESPEWIPAGSICSIIPMIWTSSPSQIESDSASSARSKKWSIRISLPGKFFNELTNEFSKSSSLITILIPCPPKTYEGRTNTGYPTCLATFNASSAEVATPYFGYGISNSFNRSEKRPRSSAKS